MYVLYIRDKHTGLRPETTSPAMQMYFTFMLINFFSIASRTSLWRKKTMNLSSIPSAKSCIYFKTGSIYKQQVRKLGWQVNNHKGLMAELYINMVHTCVQVNGWQPVMLPTEGISIHHKGIITKFLAVRRWLCRSPILLSYLILLRLASFHNLNVLTLFYVSLFYLLY